MKTNSNIWNWLAVIIVIIVGVNFFILRKPYSTKVNNFDNRIDSINKINDSLMLVISDNIKKLNEADSVAKQLEIQIGETKFKLGELTSKSIIYQKLYNEEHNRINTLTNPQLIREFTVTFD
jgi:hypothetical protein